MLAAIGFRVRRVVGVGRVFAGVLLVAVFVLRLFVVGRPRGGRCLGQCRGGLGMCLGRRAGVNMVVPFIPMVFMFVIVMFVIV